MAHKTLIDGTAYEISGGKTLVDGTAYAISGGKTLVGGTVYEVGFSKLPADIKNSLEFASADAFSIKVSAPGWTGTMEYCNGEEGWQTWDGSEISSYKTAHGHCIYIRGIGNTKITKSSSNGAWTLTGTNIACNGNIETLLDYASVATGIHPSMDSSCYTGLFRGCTSLTSAPSLPATTLMDSCYREMFRGCTSLTSAPSLPATTIAGACYYSMFKECTSLIALPALPATLLPMMCYGYMFEGCTNIKISKEQKGTYTQAYRIPPTGEGLTQANAMSNMFAQTGGEFRGTGSVNLTYYLDSSNTIVY